MRFLLLSLLALCNGQPKEPKVFYNIAHMVNAIDQIDYYLMYGANAVEADVDFMSNGTASYMYHGVPCDCFRDCKKYESVPKYLDYAREITKPENKNYKKHFALLFLDLKTSKLPRDLKQFAGEEFAKMIIKHIFEGGKTTSKLNLQISINYVTDANFVIGFNSELENQKLQHLNERIGWDVSFNEPLSEIKSMWRKVGSVTHIWQGDGISNCLSPFRKSRRLRHALVLEQHCSPKVSFYCFRKVYQWTVDLYPKLREALRLGVDGVITNKPWRLMSVLNEDEFKDKFRLADQFDNPWSPTS